MRRILVVAVLFAFPVIAVRADTESKEKEESLAATFKQLSKELVKKLQDTEAKEEREKLITSYAKKFLDLARKHPRDETTFDLLVQVVLLPLPDTKDGPRSEAAAILKKDHLKNENWGEALADLAQNSDETSISLIKAVFERKDTAVRGEAFHAYMTALGNVICESSDSKRVEAARKTMADLRKVMAKEFPKTKDLYIGAIMPDLKSKNLEGKTVRLSDLKGKVVVLDIWATWCPPCREMIPHSRQLVKKLKGKPFVLVGVSVDEEKETLTNFMERNPMPWTHWWNGESGGIVDQLNVESYPTIYVLDDKGVIRYKNVRGEDMDKAVERLLAETAKKSKDKKE
jgi:thiol-disulfide isomerase/thioredoxin